MLGPSEKMEVFFSRGEVFLDKPLMYLLNVWGHYVAFDSCVIWREGRQGCPLHYYFAIRK